jgi:hypothetical protein
MRHAGLSGTKCDHALDDGLFSVSVGFVQKRSQRILVRLVFARTVTACNRMQHAATLCDVLSTERVMQSEAAFQRGGAAQTVLRAFAIAWRALCVPVHSVLALIEPVVSIVLGLLALLGVCMSFAFKFLRPEFPFWTMLSVSLSFLVALMLYHAVLRVTAGK